jgi:MFS family permease
MHSFVPDSTASADRTVGIAVAIASVTLAGVGLALSIPLLAFAMEARGAPGWLIGLNTAMGGLATVVAAPLIPRAAGLVGVRMLLLLALALGAATMLGFAVVTPLWAWFPLRFSLGVSLAVLFVLSEFWINAAAPEKSRGLVMGVYATALSIGFGCGPLILAATGMDGYPPYLACAALYLVATLPLVLAGRNAPILSEPEPGRGVIFFIKLAPVATLAGFIYGAVETGAFTFLPLYGARIGLEASSAALTVTAMAFGNILFQIPLGMLSDRMDRRLLLILIGGVSAVGAGLIPLAAPSPLALYALLTLWGGLVLGLYTVGLAHLGARFSGNDLATANAAFVVMYSLGLLAGPPALGIGFDLWPPHGAPAAIALMLLAFFAVALWRRRSA